MLKLSTKLFLGIIITVMLGFAVSAVYASDQEQTITMKARTSLDVCAATEQTESLDEEQAAKALAEEQAEEPPALDANAEDLPVEEPAAEPPAAEQAAEEPPVPEENAEDLPVEAQAVEPSAEEQAAEETPAQEHAAEETPAQEPTAEETPAQEHAAAEPPAQKHTAAEPPADQAQEPENPSSSEVPKREEKNTPDEAVAPEITVSCKKFSWDIQRNVDRAKQVVWNKTTHAYDEIETDENVSYTVTGPITKPLTITNTGMVPVQWQIDTSDTLFQVSSTSGLLGIGENCTINVTLQTCMINEGNRIASGSDHLIISCLAAGR